MRRHRFRLLCCCLPLALLLLGGQGKRPVVVAPPGAAPTAAVTWSFSWTPATGEAVPKAEVCPLKYGKEWAYAVEIDDGPASTATVAQPLLAGFAFTDAPPGVPGGKRMPFVGGAAIFLLRTDAGNPTFLDRAQLLRLRQQGWATLNHSYWHSGNHWEPKAALNREQIRRELYWSQALLAAGAGNGGRAATHFVYPNGYTAYAPYLKEFGLLSASRVGGRCRNLLLPGADLTDLDRNNLDEGGWAQAAGGAMAGFPDAPKRGDLVIDFTHGVDPDPQSANHLRWRERLSAIQSRFGRGGADALWCAPTSEIVAYSLAARAASVRGARGRVTVSLPASAPGGAGLTLRLTGVRPGSRLAAPEGGALYRRGNEVWVTTPPLNGRPGGAAVPSPALVRAYRGPVRDVLRFAKPVRVAGVRLLQQGEPRPGFVLKIGVVKAGGGTEVLSDGAPGTNWGAWLLYPFLPDRPAPLAMEVRVTPDPALREMEVWATAP